MTRDLTYQIKAVKNSTFIHDGKDYICFHYGSIIFQANEKKIKRIYCPSTTSSKMAKRCFEHVFNRIPDPKEWKALKENNWEKV